MEAQCSGIMHGGQTAHTLRQPFVHNVMHHAVVIQTEYMTKLMYQYGERIQPLDSIARIRRAVVSAHSIFFVQHRGGINKPTLTCSIG